MNVESGKRLETRHAARQARRIMALKPCDECGKQMAEDARTCPHCGKTYTTGSGIFIAILIGLILGGFFLASR